MPPFSNKRSYSLDTSPYPKRRKAASKKKTTVRKRTYVRKMAPAKLALPASIVSYNKMLKAPFASSTTPCTLPDQYTGISNGMMLESSYQIETDVNGGFSRAFAPAISAFTRINTLDAAGVMTAGSTIEHPDYSSAAGLQLNTHAHKIRVLSLNVELSYVGQNQLRSGAIRHIMSTNSVDTDTTQWEADSGVSGEIPVSSKSIVYKSHLFDHPEFKALNATDLDTVMQTIWLAGWGLPPSSVCIIAKTRLFVELIPRTNSILALSAVNSPAPPASSTIPPGFSMVMQT